MAREESTDGNLGGPDVGWVEKLFVDPECPLSTAGAARRKPVGCEEDDPWTHFGLTAPPEVGVSSSEADRVAAERLVGELADKGVTNPVQFPACPERKPRARSRQKPLTRRHHRQQTP